ncbi:hypothetical protein ACFL4W_03310, partial [Planctomycetota bacterium]
VYGWSLCGGQHSVLSSLWVAAGWEHRFVGWPGHTTVEVKYDNAWHYFDTFLKFYTWREDINLPGGRTIASQAEIAADPELVNKLFYDQARRVYYFPDNRFELINGKANWVAPSLLVCGDGPQGVISGCQKRRNASSPKGWAGINHDEGGYNTDVNLGPGMSLELMWKALPESWYWKGQKNAPSHTCNDKEFRNCPIAGPILEPYIGVYPRGTRSYANGVFTYAPDLSGKGFLAGLAGHDNAKVAGGQVVPADPGRPATLTLRLQLPYVFVKATAQAEGVERAELSVDKGKTFKPVDLKDFSAAIKGVYDTRLKLTIPTALKALKLEAIVQHNRGAAPYLSPGKNKIAVTVADPAQLGDNRLCVTYAYSSGTRAVPYDELIEGGFEVARGHKAAWSEAPTVVQKIFAAKDLPGEFDIDIATPKDKYPVYPRMLFLRRELLGPGQKPMALPDGAVEPLTGPETELKALPNPFLMGTMRAPKKIPRPTKTVTLPLAISHAVSETGETEPNHFIKTKSGEHWIILVSGDLGELPAIGDLAAARLVLPVVKTRSKAKTKIAAMHLKAAFKADAPYDFKNIGKTMGIAMLPATPQPNDPPVAYKIDITGSIKSVIRGKIVFNGIALKTIPDRAVDDGYIVRADFSKEAEICLEVDIYTKKLEMPAP